MRFEVPLWLFCDLGHLHCDPQGQPEPFVAHHRAGGGSRSRYTDHLDSDSEEEQAEEVQEGESGEQENELLRLEIDQLSRRAVTVPFRFQRVKRESAPEAEQRQLGFGEEELERVEELIGGQHEQGVQLQAPKPGVVEGKSGLH